MNQGTSSKKFFALIASFVALAAIVGPLTLGIANGSFGTNSASDVSPRLTDGTLSTVVRVSQDDGPITVAPVDIVGFAPSRLIAVHPVKVASRVKVVCQAHDEGVRRLEQGSGTVHTYTFCR